jgi:hypothetical protein
VSPFSGILLLGSAFISNTGGALGCDGLLLLVVDEEVDGKDCSDGDGVIIGEWDDILLAAIKKIGFFSYNWSVCLSLYFFLYNSK